MNMEEQDVPHAGEELDETSVSEGEGDGDVGRSDAASVEVDARKDEGREGESRKTQWRWVGELSVLVGLPQSGLERATECLRISFSHVPVVGNAGKGPGVSLSVVAYLGTIEAVVMVSTRCMHVLLQVRWRDGIVVSLVRGHCVLFRAYKTRGID